MGFSFPRSLLGVFIFLQLLHSVFPSQSSRVLSHILCVSIYVLKSYNMSCFVVLKTDSKYTVVANIQGGLKHWKVLLLFLPF